MLRLVLSWNDIKLLVSRLEELVFADKRQGAVNEQLLVRSALLRSS